MRKMNINSTHAIRDGPFVVVNKINYYDEDDNQSRNEQSVILWYSRFVIDSHILTHTIFAIGRKTRKTNLSFITINRDWLTYWKQMNNISHRANFYLSYRIPHSYVSTPLNGVHAFIRCRFSSEIMSAQVFCFVSRWHISRDTFFHYFFFLFTCWLLTQSFVCVHSSRRSYDFLWFANHSPVNLC